MPPFQVIPRRRLRGLGSSLRNQLHFPPFLVCPNDKEIDESLYVWRDGTRLMHWCFIGMVVDSMVAEDGTLLLKVMDASTKKGWIAFRDPNDKDHGFQFIDPNITYEPRKAKKGHVVALLYPVLRNDLPGGREGLIVDDTSNFTVLPYGLEQLIDANDRLSKIPKQCCAEGCSNTESLKDCSVCHVAKYCSREHQTQHWKKHKPECKVNEALRWFTQKDWTHYESKFSFP